jgi:hypothetical protein
VGGTTKVRCDPEPLVGNISMIVIKLLGGTGLPVDDAALDNITAVQRVGYKLNKQFLKIS